MSKIVLSRRENVTTIIADEGFKVRIEYRTKLETNAVARPSKHYAEDKNRAVAKWSVLEQRKTRLYGVSY